jgi:hypothetical protein
VLNGLQQGETLGDKEIGMIGVGDDVWVNGFLGTVLSVDGPVATVHLVSGDRVSLGLDRLLLKQSLRARAGQPEAEQVVFTLDLGHLVRRETHPVQHGVRHDESFVGRVTVIAATDMAILTDADEEEWIPRSQLGVSCTLSEENDAGDLWVSEWFARKVGW